MIWLGETAGSLDSKQEQSPECRRIPDLVRYKGNPPGKDHISPAYRHVLIQLFSPLIGNFETWRFSCKKLAPTTLATNRN